MVIDEIIVKNKQVDSLSDKTIDKIIFEGQEYNFAKPSDLVSSDITTDVELLDAVNEPIIYMDIKGKTVQKSYSGKNLLNLEYILNTSVSANGGTLNCDSEGIITASGTPTGYVGFYKASDFYIPPLENGTYTFSATGDFQNIQAAIWFTNSNGGRLGGVEITPSTRKKTFSYPPYEDISKITIEIKRSETNKPISGSMKLQLEKGSVATEWEPYVGGLPSPNIAYPQPMVSTSDSNVEVSIHSRNLVPIEDTVENSASSSVKSIDITDNIMRITFNEEILPSYGANTYSSILTDKDLFDTYLTISFKYRSNRPDILVGFQIAYRETAQASITYPMRQTVGPAANGEVQTFLATTTSKIGKPGELFFYYVWKLPEEPYQLNEDDYIEIFDVMIERGSTATPYQPYFEEAIVIPTSDGINLRSIDDFYDELIIENGTVKKIQRIEETTFLTTELGSWLRISGRVYERVFWPSHPTKAADTKMLSDKLNWVSNILSGDVYSSISSTHPAGFWLSLDSDFDTLEDFFVRYNEVNPKFQYVLDTPIETDITNTPIGQALLHLSTNVGTNILHIVSSSINPSLVSTKYYKQIRP